MELYWQYQRLSTPLEGRAAGKADAGAERVAAPHQHPAVGGGMVQCLPAGLRAGSNLPRQGQAGWHPQAGTALCLRARKHGG